MRSGKRISKTINNIIKYNKMKNYSNLKNCSMYINLAITIVKI